jgi:dTDP-4-amino-4,6-dideoxygalactose transaminase
MAIKKYIPFNKPYQTGKELEYIENALKNGKISGNGIFTNNCHNLLSEKYGFEKVLLTSSCTDALEMTAILSNIQPGDEVIVPSFTFVSTALAFVRQGAKVVFVDSGNDNPNMDVELIEELISPKTKAIVPVHYAGVSCDMDRIIEIAKKNNLTVIEDAAQAIDSYYKGRPLGSIGQYGCFSFHETKNIISGEGGALVVNDKKQINRSEIIWEKGTNRAEFFRGEVNKYGWVDLGSSFLPSDITAAFLYAQLESINDIQKKRIQIWEHYYSGLKSLELDGKIILPTIPDYATNNAHLFYILCRSLEERTELINFLKSKGIMAVFHYLSLHQSQYYSSISQSNKLVNSEYYSDHLLRLPLYYELNADDIQFIIDSIETFYR